MSAKIRSVLTRLYTDGVLRRVADIDKYTDEVTAAVAEQNKENLSNVTRGINADT